MSTTIAFITTTLGVTVHGPVPWGDNIPSSNRSVYIICLKSPVISPDFDSNAIDYWIRTTPRLTLSGRTHSSIKVADICNELSKFWIPDETIIYVGRSKKIRKRVYQYYGTPLGMKRPHKGGYWIKTFAGLCLLDIYWIESLNDKELEKQVIELFSRNVTTAYRNNKIFRPGEHLPFANLRMPGSGIKKHGIEHPY